MVGFGRREVGLPFGLAGFNSDLKAIGGMQPNFGPPGHGLRLKPGLVLAIEPMVNAGSAGVRVDRDGWTARTEDGSLSAHFEFSVALTSTGPRVLGVGSAAA